MSKEENGDDGKMPTSKADWVVVVTGGNNGEMSGSETGGGGETGDNHGWESLGGERVSVAVKAEVDGEEARGMYEWAERVGEVGGGTEAAAEGRKWREVGEYGWYLRGITRGSGVVQETL